MLSYIMAVSLSLLNKSRNRYLVAGCVAVAIFALDCSVHLGTAVGVLYMAVIWITFSSGVRKSLLIAASACSLLTLLGWLALQSSPASSAIPSSIIVMNRLLALFAIWTTTGLFIRTIQLTQERWRSELRDQRLQKDLISEHARASEIEECSRLTIDAAMDAVIMMDEQGVITNWNAQAERDFLWLREEAIGKSLADLIVPERFRDAHRNGLERFLETGESKILGQRLELSAVRKTGEEFPIELNIIAMEISGQSQFSAFVRNITEQKRVVEALQERDRRITTLVNSTAEGIYGIDRDGHCTFANAACARMLGFDSPDDLFGLNMHLLIHHSQSDGTPASQEECKIFQAFQKGIGTHVDDECFWRKDGGSFPVEYWSYPVHFEGDITGSVVTFVNVQERKNREREEAKLKQELEQSIELRGEQLVITQNQLDVALKGANVGLWDWNAITDEVYFSPTAKTQLGYSEDEVWTNLSDWESRLHPDDHESAVKVVTDYFESRGDSYESTFRLRCKDGTYRWILSLGRGEFDKAGVPLRLLGVHVDINERVENEKTLEFLNERLASAVDALHLSNVDLQQFAYVASHDLQTPLRAIANFAQFLKADYGGKLDATADDYIERIVQGAHRMQQLIRDLLAYSRVESRAEPFRTVAMNEVFEDAAGLLSESIMETNATVLRDELPEIQGDKAQLTQLLMNLISNAIKYHSERPPRVHVRSESDEESFTIRVQDNGIGIDPKHHERVFEIFRRLHTQSAYPGTGIGLAVCRRIVNRHRGEIWIESPGGIGSTFVFKIPRDPNEDSN